MLEELYLKGYLDYEGLIFDYSKSLGLNAEEAFVLVHILKNYAKMNTLSIQTIEKQILMTSSKLDKIVAALMERGFYEVYLSYDNGKGSESISFKPLFNMLENIINNKNNIDSYDIEKANQYISLKMNRILTASELEILQGLMIDEHYTYDQIAKSVDYIVDNKKSMTMRSIVLALSNKKYELEVKNTAPTAFQDFLKRI